MRTFIFRFSLRVLIAFILISSSMMLVSGCRIFKRDKQSIAEKKQEEVDKKATAEYEKARKQHYKNQSKDAKSMMKQTRKQASEYNKPKKRKGLFKARCD